MWVSSRREVRAVCVVGMVSWIRSAESKVPCSTSTENNSKMGFVAVVVIKNRAF